MDENSVVDFMKSKGLDSSFEARKHLAEAHYGVTNYTGTAEQNVKLLAKLKQPVTASFWDDVKAEFHKLFGGPHHG
jgi:hypothetical protein